MSKNAFTIIELLISVGIISIILGVSFAGYARLNQRQTLISAGQNLKNMLRDAQNRAVNAELDCGTGKCDCISGADTGYSGWYADLGSAQKIYAKCSAYQFGDKTLGLSSEVGISPYLTPAGTVINFKNNPPSVVGNGYICLTHNNLPATYYTVRVSQTGVISDDGGLAAACTP